MKIRVFNRKGELVGPVESATVVKSDAEWQRRLTPEQYEVARGKGTGRTGIPCAGCGARLGRVFEDGPRPSGPRFCVNTESLVFA